ncbi:MAG TPA: methyltransferase regulatory domain-containing protein, partial [Candidatus Limnocylindria bacterium]|nr:methyltransferase regulatory domain-containing protein [Candidatus Limnocylindria bacterium]
MSSIQEEYETLPYPHYVHPLSDPARSAVLGRLFGRQPADPRQARVLELGCGSGSNLLTLAARFPGSRFLGLDFSGPDIAAAREVAAEARLANVEFQQADLLTWTPPGQQFDYVIAYGLISWVADEVKARALELARACLAPQGIACFSYLTYPGCKQPEALRDLLRLHTEGLADAAEKLAAAQAVLGFLDGACGAQKNRPQAASLQAEVRRIRAKEPAFLLHDDLGVQRDPCYLLQFTGWAAEHGLQYLADSELHTMLAENLPLESARALLALKLDRLETEQFLDYVTNRSFRCSLMVGPEVPVNGRLHASALRELCFAPVLREVPLAKPGDTEAQFRAADGTSLTVRSVPLLAFLRALGAGPDGFTPFADVLAEAEAVTGRPFTPAERAQLDEDLLTLYGRRQLELSAVPCAPVERVPERPALTPLNRVMARRRGIVVTVRQQSQRLAEAERHFCRLLDGSRTLAQLRASPEAAAFGGAVEAFLSSLTRNGCLA